MSVKWLTETMYVIGSVTKMCSMLIL